VLNFVSFAKRCRWRSTVSEVIFIVFLVIEIGSYLTDTEQKKHVFLRHNTLSENQLSLIKYRR